MDGGGPSRRQLGSLDLVLAETRGERELQLRLVDGLDAKAGILPGFSGALVALASSSGILIGIGRFVAVVAGLASLSAFWPRTLEALDVYALRQKYLAAEPEFTKLKLLDTLVTMVADAGVLQERKARRLKWAMTALSAAVLLVAIGSGLH